MALAKLFFRLYFKTFFISTFNASKVTFIQFLFEWRIACSKNCTQSAIQIKID